MAITCVFNDGEYRELICSTSDERDNASLEGLRSRLYIMSAFANY